MRGLLDPKNKLGQILGRITDMIILNLLVLLCCLPVVTAGAAFSSMHAILLKIYRGEADKIPSAFFRAMKSNLKDATLLWLMYLGFLAALTGAYFFATAQLGENAVFIVFTLLIFALFGTLYLIWALILQSHYKLSIGEYLKFAVVIWFRNPGSTFVWIIACVLVVVLSLVISTAPVALLLGFTLPGMLTTTMVHRIFEELDGTVQKEEN